MINVPSILAELVHHESQISDMVGWYDICAAYPDSSISNFFKLLMGSKNNEFSFFLI